MNVKTYSYWMIALAVILFTSCDKSNESNEKIKDDESLIFSIRHFGGMLGYSESLEINAGATHYSVSYYDISIRDYKKYQTTIETSGELWDYLIKTFDLKTFTKIKEGPCRACLDGFDSIISVIKDGETYSVRNGITDKHYQKIQNFFDSIFEQLEDFRANLTS